MKAHRKLIRHLLEANKPKEFTPNSLVNTVSISVDDGGDELALSRSTNYQEIIDAIEAVEIATIRVHVTTSEWAQIIPFGVDDDETVVDFSCDGRIDAWFESEVGGAPALEGSE